MARVLWLADKLRAAGLTVVEHSGWQTREIAGVWEPRFAVVHATAAPTTQSDSTQIAIVRDGRGDLAGPIANCCVDHQGRWHVLGAGRCNTVKTGWAGPYAGLGNRYAFGVEACNDNRSEPWPAVQYEAYARGYAAILDGFGWTTSHLIGHKEHQPGDKTDPTFNMDQFRARVNEYMKGDADMPLTDADVAKIWAAMDAGKDVNMAGAMHEAHARAAYAFAMPNVIAGKVDQLLAKLGGLPADLAGRLDQILAAASDDPATSVTMSSEDRQALATELANAVAGPLADAVVDEQAARLQS